MFVHLVRLGQHRRFRGVGVLLSFARLWIKRQRCLIGVGRKRWGQLSGKP